MVTTEPKYWRDIRDGEPPPSAYKFMRYVVQKGARFLSPPLTQEDVFFLSAEAFADRFFLPFYEGKEPVGSDKLHNVVLAGVFFAYVAAPDFAKRIGILEYASREAARYASHMRYFRWHEEVHDLMARPDDELNEFERRRAHCLRFQFRQFFEALWSQSPAGLMAPVDAAITDSVGGNEWDARNRKRHEPEEAFQYLKLATKAGASLHDLVKVSKGKFRFDRSTCADEFRERLSNGAPIERGCGEARYASSLSETVADPKLPKPAAKVAHGPTQELERIEVIRALRDLREERAAAEQHALLEQVFDAFERNLAAGLEGVALLRSFCGELDAARKPAKRAELVYALGGRKRAGWPVWTREEVAAQYGVSVDSMLGQRGAAAAVISRLGA